MAYLHCHSCDWSQDDFWSKGYNPLQSLVNMWQDLLLREPLDELKDYDAWDKGGNHYKDWKSNREVIAGAVEEAAAEIRSMQFKTVEDLRSTDSPTCPKCGSGDLDID